MHADPHFWIRILIVRYGPWWYFLLNSIEYDLLWTNWSNLKEILGQIVYRVRKWLLLWSYIHILIISNILPGVIEHCIDFQFVNRIPADARYGVTMIASTSTVQQSKSCSRYWSSTASSSSPWLGWNRHRWRLSRVVRNHRDARFFITLKPPHTSNICAISILSIDSNYHNTNTGCDDRLELSIIGIIITLMLITMMLTDFG